MHRGSFSAPFAQIVSISWWGEKGRACWLLLWVVAEEQQPQEVSVALWMWLQKGSTALEENLTQKGGFVPPGHFWVVCHPGLLLRSAKPGAGEEDVPGRKGDLPQARKENRRRSAARLSRLGGGRGLGPGARWLRSELAQGAADFHLQMIASFLAQAFPHSPRQPSGGGEAVGPTRASWSGGRPTPRRTRLPRRWPACWQLRSSYQGWKALYAWSQFLRLQFILPGWSGGRLVQEARGMLAQLLSGSRLVAERRFAFQERPATAFPQGSVLWNVFLRPIPRELWQLFDVVTALLENGWDNGRSETQIFSSRLCGSFIKNRQINKQITAH